VKSLLNKVETVYSGLFGSTEFDDPEGDTSVMRGYVGAIPGKRDTEAQGEDFPYRLTKLAGFDLTRDGVRYNVVTEIGVYEGGDIDAALTMVDSVMSIIDSIPSQSFAPFKLIGEATGEMSENRHPYYQITISHTFRNHN
jgi:hypothetical protein